MAVATQHSSFQNRLARIEKRGVGRAELLAGIAEERVSEHAIRRAVAKRKKPGLSLWKVIGLPIAVGVGAAAMLAGHVVEFRFTDQMIKLDQELGITTMFAADIVLAAVISMVILMMFKLRGMVYGAAAAAGFALIIFHEIDLAKAYPDVWAQIYSPNYIARSLRAGEMLRPEFPTNFHLT